MAIVLKPPGLMFLLLFVRRRHARAFAVLLIASAALWLLVLLRYGPSGTVALVHEWSALVERTTAPWVLGYNPQGLPTVLLAPFFPVDAIPAPAILTLAQLSAVALFVGAIALLRPRAPGLQALFILGVALLSPHAWRANFVLALPAVLLAVSSRERVGWLLLAAIGLVGAVVQAGLLGEPLFRRVMTFRPFALAFIALAAWILWTQRGPRRTGAAEMNSGT
ncbi:MAG: hypothetical protein IRZ16_18725 [Myxococcaceae bacterium]|nr:hypothetical protein [Myxococcaceae bacterium]